MPHPWPVFTPEDNHTVLTRLGTGSATTLAYHAALTAQIAHLESLTAASSASGAGTYGLAWQGVSAAASAVSQSGLNTATSALGAWLAAKLPLVATTVSAYHGAVAAMVPAEEAVANRVEEAVDEQINPWVWGALTPRIVALNLDYFGHMWPRNAAAGAAYGATAQASAAAMLAVPPPLALAGGSVAAPAGAAATIAEDGGVGAAGAAMRTSVRAAEAVIAPAGVAPQALGRAAVQVPAALRPLAGMQPPAAAMTPNAAVGMFAPLQAAVSAPAVQTAAASEAGQLAAAPRGGVAAPAGMGYPGAGLTSYVRPTDGFTSPPTGGRATGATPGMLNAAALRGTLTNSPTTAQPLAYASPNPLPDTGQVLHAEPTQPLPARPLVPPMPVPPESTSPKPSPNAPAATATGAVLPLQPTPAVGNPAPTAAPSIGNSPDEGAQTLGTGDLKETPGADALSVHDAHDVHKIVDPLPPGRKPGVKTLPTPDEIRRLYEDLTDNATPMPPGTYKGQWQVLEDGTKIGYRPNSGWGGPTVEIWYPNGTDVAVHLPERPRVPEPTPAPVPTQLPATTSVPAPTPSPAPADPGPTPIHLPPVQPPPPDEAGWLATIGAAILGGLAVLGSLGEALK